MKVRDLIAQLQKLDPELPVYREDPEVSWFEEVTAAKKVTGQRDHNGDVGPKFDDPEFGGPTVDLVLIK